MHWYYAENSQQLGPFTESRFNELVDSGVITPTTMIWHDGLADWQPYQEFAALTASEGEPLDQCICCAQRFARQDLITINQGFICGQCKPDYFQRLKEGLSPLPDTARIWREGKVLVMEKTASMPPRCVKCNKPADTVWTKKLSYNHPAVYLLLIINVLVLVIVAAFTSKKATIDIPVCDSHRSRIKRAIAMSWFGCLGGIALIFCAIAMENGVMGIAGGIALLVGAVVGIARGRLVYASKIDKEHVWMKGICSEYLDSIDRH